MRDSRRREKSPAPFSVPARQSLPKVSSSGFRRQWLAPDANLPAATAPAQELLTPSLLAVLIEGLEAFLEKGSDPLIMGGLTPFPNRLLSAVLDIRRRRTKNNRIAMTLGLAPLFRFLEAAALPPGLRVVSLALKKR